MNGKALEFYENEPVPDEEMQNFINEEIAGAPSNPEELLDRVREHHSSSPADSGGDIDAEWEDVNDSGAETVFGHNPTPDQSDVEENAHAIGVNFEDNQELDLHDQLERRDRRRFELDPRSKTEDDTI